MSAPPIPVPRLQRVDNRTPFLHFQCDKMGVGRRFYDTVVVKGTFDLAPGPLKIAARQAPIALADDYWDLAAPERSSVKHAGEAVLCKPSTDVLVTGTVRAPGGRPASAWDVAVVVADRGRTALEYAARVTGPRAWRYTSLRGWALSDPEPAAEVPIRYELAYGGAYPAADRAGPRWIVHEDNPSGTGFFDERALDVGREYRAPQWHLPLAPPTAMNRAIPLAGFGPIARPWRARLQYAGTYDDAWEQATRADVARGLPADYAPDFDARFFQCAHPSLITRAHLRGDERVGLHGMLAEHRELALQLPGVDVAAVLRDGRAERHEERLSLDTLHVDLDARVVHLCWRLTLDQARDIRSALLYISTAKVP
jgi:hypothetical protein